MSDVTPRFSVITPAFDAERTLRRCVESVRAQTRADWEHIVVDDGSTDDTPSIAETLAAEDPRLRVERQPNAGAAVARNRGIASARGEWLVFLDADDALEPTCLERIAAAIDSMPGVDVVGCNGTRTYPNGLQTPAFPEDPSVPVREISLEDHIAASQLTVTSAVRRAVVDAVGGFRDTYAEDYDLWLRVLASGARVVRLEERLVCFDFSSAGAKSRDREPELDSVIGSLEELRAAVTAEKTRRLIDTALVRNRADRELVGVKRRVRAGDYRGARGAFWRNRAAMSGMSRWAVVGLVLVSPRLYRALVVRKDPSA